ncbi:MAG: hypothetical protein WDO13_15080 [Verrucomicrobiota bacterium]
MKPPRKPGLRLTEDPQTNAGILSLVESWHLPEFSGEFAEMIASLHKLSQQEPSSSDVVLFKRAMAELRYAQSVFAPTVTCPRSASSARRARGRRRPPTPARRNSRS